MVQSLAMMQLLMVFSIEWSENKKVVVGLMRLALVRQCSKWR